MHPGHIFHGTVGLAGFEVAGGTSRKRPPTGAATGRLGRWTGRNTGRTRRPAQDGRSRRDDGAGWFPLLASEESEEVV